MYSFAQQVLVALSSIFLFLKRNLILALYPNKLIQVLFFFYLLSILSPIWAMDEDEDVLPCPSSFVQLHPLRTNSSGQTYITFEIEGEPQIIPLIPSAPSYNYTSLLSVPDSAPDPNDASAWVEAIQNWANNSYATPVKNYRFVYDGKMYKLADILPNAPRYAYNLDFHCEDDTAEHVTVMSAVPFFMDGSTKVPLTQCSSMFRLLHLASSRQVLENKDILFYDGRMLYKPDAQSASYECPPVRGIPQLEKSRLISDNTPDYSSTGCELGCLALTATTIPEGDHVPSSVFYQKRESDQDTESPFIYSDGQGLFMTRRIKSVCSAEGNDDIKYLFDYVLPTSHKFQLKEDCKLSSSAQIQPGFLPKGLYEWRGDGWVAVDRTFNRIAVQSYQIQSPASQTTCFLDVIFDPSISNTQVIEDTLQAPYLTVLNFSKRVFRDADQSGLDSVLRKLTNLEYLTLNSNGILGCFSYVNTFANTLTGLTDLKLHNNLLHILPPAFGNLIRLTSLDLSENELVDLPVEFGNLTRLKNLNLANNLLKLLPPAFGNLISLTSLDLSENQLVDLPVEFGNLTELRNLNLANNLLKILPPAFGNLTKLSVLFLGQNELTSLPVEFGNLTSLTFLYLSQNQLSELPATIGNLTELIAFGVSNNNLQCLPSGYSGLINLETLNLHHNQLASFPPNFGNLAKLTDLDLSDNKLSSFPAGFGNLTRLTTFSFHNNQLTSLTPKFGSLTTLTDLELSGNDLKLLPTSFGNLTGLTTLKLEAVRLLELPIEFGNLTGLMLLDLDNNDLQRLPVAFVNLTRLERLYFKGNDLRFLPAGFDKLTKLTCLDLDHNNQLMVLHSELESISKLALTALGLPYDTLTTLPNEYATYLDSLRLGSSFTQ